MDYGINSAQMIDVDRVFLDQDNPRHERFVDQEAVIEYLCNDEKILQLARDIVKYGLNPVELFALIPDGDNTYLAAEGNRRLCALKLLNDPDLAPPSIRKEIENAADAWQPIKQLFAIVFTTRDEVRLWLDRIHAGFNDGRGRRQWNAEQKARNSGYSKNDRAQAILDVAQHRGYISEERRKGRLSTVQRYLGSPHLRNSLGVDFTDRDEPTTDLSEEDFSLVLSKFIEDVAEKRITTRNNSDEIKNYANGLGKIEGFSGNRVDKRPIVVSEEDIPRDDDQKLTRPKMPTKIPPIAELSKALQELPSYKLEKLYDSICSINLSTHTPMLYVGTWALIETLTAIDGRKDNTDFHSFLSTKKLIDLGIEDKDDRTTIRQVLKRVSEAGNSTKHHKTSAAFNGEQLANDIKTLEQTLVLLAKSAKGKG